MRNEDSALRHSIQWTREIAKNYDGLTVISTYLGNHQEFSPNSRLVELGGGSLINRLVAFYKLWILALTFYKDRNHLVAFYHMTHKPLNIIGPVLRIMGIRQVLWYSHSRKSLSLRFAMLWANAIVSPTIRCFPYSTEKVVPVGHGVTTHSVRLNQIESRDCSEKVLVLGRIARIKRIENLIYAIFESQSRFKISLCGRIESKEYLSYLTNEASAQQIELEVLGDLSGESLENKLSEFCIGFSGTVGSVDKAPLEMNQFGIFVASDNEDLQTLSGQNEIICELFGVTISEFSVREQIAWWKGLTKTEKKALSCRLSQFSQTHNTIPRVAQNIQRVLNDSD